MIRADNLEKRFGAINAVRGVSFHISTSEVVGFLGPNGAGKTTTMQMLTGFLAPSGGRAVIGGIDVTDNPMAVKRLIGYLPENNPIYPDLSVSDFLRFMGGVRGVDSRRMSDAVTTAAKLCGLGDVLHRRMGALSKGYRQRAGIAQALLNDPEILILDEPTTGLDPNQIVEIRELIRELGRHKTVILSTHIMQEVEQTCRRAIIINNGRIVANGTLSELGSTTWRYCLITEPELPAADLRTFGDVHSSAHGGVTITAKSDVSRQIAEYCRQKDVLVLEFSRERESLEDMFRKLTTEGTTEEVTV